MLKWVNEEVRLERPVVSADDLSTGYLVGNLLAKFNQQPDFPAAFVDSAQPSAVLSNWRLLEGTLRRLGINMNGRDAAAVAAKAPGASMKLLYRIKVAVEGLGAAPVGRVTGDKYATLAQTRAKVSKPAYDAAASASFIRTLAAALPSSTSVSMQAVTKRFVETRVAMEEAAAAAVQQEIIDAAAARNAARSQRMHALKREHEILADNHGSGREEWERNQEIRMAQVYADTKFAEKQKTMTTHKLQQRNQQESSVVLTGIQDFESRASTDFGISTKAGLRPEHIRPDPRPYDQFVEDLAAAVPDSASMAASLDMQMAALHARRQAAAAGRARRHERRRSFVTTSLELREKQLLAARDAWLQAKLGAASVYEQQIAPDVEAVALRKQVYADNRAAREAAYQVQRHLDEDTLRDRARDLYEAQVSTHEHDLARHSQRFDESVAARRSVHLTRHTDMCRDVALKIVEAALTVARQRELRESDPSALFKNDVATVFASNVPVVEGAAEPAGRAGTTTVAVAGVVGDEEDKGRCAAGLESKIAEPAEVDPALAAAGALLDRQWFIDYCSKTKHWEAAVPADVIPDVPDIAVDAGEHAHVVISAQSSTAASAQWALGAVARAVEEAIYPPPQPVMPPAVPRYQIRVCVLGPAFSGRSTQAAKLAVAYNLRLLDPEALVRELVQFSGLSLPESKPTEAIPPVPVTVQDAGFGSDEAKQAWADVVGPLAEAAVERLLSGLPITDEIYVGTLVAAVVAMGSPSASKWRGWVIDGFPETGTQARLLEAALTGWVPHVPPAPTQVQEWSAIVAPSLPPPVEPDFIPAPYGIDLAIMLDLPHEATARRAFGRRIHETTGTNYHLDMNPPSLDDPTQHLLLELVDANNVPYKLSDIVEATLANSHDVATWFQQGNQLRRVSAMRADAEAAVVPHAAVLSAEDMFNQLSALVECIVAAAQPAPVADGGNEAVVPQVSLPPTAERAAARSDEGSESKTGRSEPSAASSRPPATARSVGGSNPLEFIPNTGTHFRWHVPLIPHSPALSLLGKRWLAAVDTYGSSCYAALRALRLEDRSAVVRLAVVRRRYEQFLRRPAPVKQAILDTFQASFNAVEASMRFQEPVKNELHLRTDEAALKLWEIVTSRRLASESELASIKSDPWLDDVRASVLNQFCVLIQAEVDRFTASRQLLIDYYSAASGGPISVANADDLTATIPLVAAFGAPEEEEAKAKPGAKGGKPAPAKGAKGKEEEAPADELAPIRAAATKAKTLANAAMTSVAGALKAQNDARVAKAVEVAEAAAAAAAAAAGAAAPKGKGAKDTKKKDPKKKDAAPEDSVALPFVYLPPAVFEALRYEAAAVGRRIAALEVLAQQWVQSFAADFERVIASLGARCATRFAREGTAIEAFVGEVGSAIETESQLVFQLRLEGEYFIVDTSNRVVPAPEAPAPRMLEGATAVYLAPSQLSTLSHALRSAAVSVPGAAHYRAVLIPAWTIISVTRRLAAAGKLPAAWARFPMSVYQQLVAAFDPDETGLVDWRQFIWSLARYLPALRSVPSARQLSGLKTLFARVDSEGGGRIPVSAIANERLWFEDDADLWLPSALEAKAGELAKTPRSSEDAASDRVSAAAAAAHVRRAVTGGWTDADGLLDYRRCIGYWAGSVSVDDTLDRVFGLFGIETGSDDPVIFDDVANVLFVDPTSSGSITRSAADERTARRLVVIDAYQLLNQAVSTQ